MQHRAFAFGLSLAMAASLSTAPVAVAAGTIGLPDCQGRAVVRPSSVELACADGGVSVSRLTWEGWGDAFAAGIGTASINDCTPNCAAGHEHNFRVVLIAEGRERCPNGTPAYARLTMAYLTETPGRQQPPFDTQVTCRS